MPRRNPASAANGKRGGRPRRPVEARTPRKDGKLAAWLPLEDMVLAQRLMLRFPQVRSIDALFSYALRRLAETEERP